MLTKPVRDVVRILTGNLRILYEWGLLISKIISILLGFGEYSLWVNLMMNIVQTVMVPMQEYQDAVIKIFAYMPYAISKEADRVYKLLSFRYLLQTGALYCFVLPCVVAYGKPLHRWCTTLHLLFWLSVTVVQVFPFLICFCLHFPALPDDSEAAKLFVEAFHATSAQRQTCVENMIKPSMSALAIVANFKPNVKVSMHLLGVILFLQAIAYITASKSDKNSTQLKQESTEAESREQHAKKTNTWQTCRACFSSCLNYLRECFACLRPVTIMVHNLLILCFQNLSLVVLTLGIHDKVDSILVTQHLVMLCVICCVQALIEQPNTHWHKFLLAVVGKIFPRIFCPIGSTVFAKVPTNTTVEHFNFTMLKNNEKHVLVCAGFLPGVCKDIKSDENQRIRLAIDILAFGSFFFHVCLGENKLPAQSPKFCIALHKTALIMWDNSWKKQMLEGGKKQRRLYWTFYHWKMCAQLQLFKKADGLQVERKVSDANLNRLNHNILTCQNLYMCMLILDRVVKRM
jgi:hypothetical protein